MGELNKNSDKQTSVSTVLAESQPVGSSKTHFCVARLAATGQSSRLARASQARSKIQRECSPLFAEVQ